jgi:hypothetical protein
MLKTGKIAGFRRAEIEAVANRNIAVYPHLTLARRSN